MYFNHSKPYRCIFGAAAGDEPPPYGFNYAQRNIIVAHRATSPALRVCASLFLHQCPDNNGVFFRTTMVAPTISPSPWRRFHPSPTEFTVAHRATQQSLSHFVTARLRAHVCHSHKPHDGRPLYHIYALICS